MPMIGKEYAKLSLHEEDCVENLKESTKLPRIKQLNKYLTNVDILMENKHVNNSILAIMEISKSHSGLPLHTD